MFIKFIRIGLPEIVVAEVAVVSVGGVTDVVVSVGVLTDVGASVVT